MTKFIARGTIVAMALLAIVGCGGGSGKGSSGGSGNNGATTSLSGVAVDDLILNGIVRAYDASDVNNTLATGRTSSFDGSYTLNVDHEGIVVVKVTCDSNSRMYNPVTEQNQTCIDGLELRSAAELTSESKSVKVNISPLTELIVRQMGDSPEPSDLLSARNSIGLAFGIDPIASSPVEDTAYSGIINALHEVAESEADQTLFDVIDDLEEDLEDGTLGDDNNITAQLATAMSDANISNNITLGEGNYTIPDYSEDILSDIGQAKAFFDELRTQAMSIADYKESGTPGFLDTEAESIGDTLRSITLNVDIAGEYLVGATKLVLVAIDENVTTRSVTINEEQGLVATVSRLNNNPLVWSYSIEENGTEKYSGTITLPAESPKDGISPGTFTTLTAQFNGTVPAKETADGRYLGTQTLVTNMTATRTATGANFVLTNATLTSGEESVSISNASLDVAYAYDNSDQDDPINIHYVKINSISMNASFGNYSIGGTITVPSYVQNSSISGNGFIQEMIRTYIYGQVNCFDAEGNDVTTNSLAAIYIDQNNQQYALSTNGNYFWGEFDGDIVGNISDITNRLNVSSQECAQINIDWSWHGTDEYGEFFNSGQVPDKISFAGDINNTANNGSISGRVNVEWVNAATMDLTSEDAMPKLSVTVNGSIQIPERELMALTLGFNNNNTNLDNNLTLSYSYGTMAVNGTANFDQNMTNGTIVLTNHLGLKATIVITEEEISYDDSNVTVNNKKIGDFEDRMGMPVIKYIDGTFESLP